MKMTQHEFAPGKNSITIFTDCSGQRKTGTAASNDDHIEMIVRLASVAEQANRCRQMISRFEKSQKSCRNIHRCAKFNQTYAWKMQQQSCHGRTADQPKKTIRRTTLIGFDWNEKCQGLTRLRDSSQRQFDNLKRRQGRRRKHRNETNCSLHRSNSDSVNNISKEKRKNSNH